MSSQFEVQGKTLIPQQKPNIQTCDNKKPVSKGSIMSQFNNGINIMKNDISIQNDLETQVASCPKERTNLNKDDIQSVIQDSQLLNTSVTQNQQVQDYFNFGSQQQIFQSDQRFFHRNVRGYFMREQFDQPSITNKKQEQNKMLRDIWENQINEKRKKIELEKIKYNEPDLKEKFQTEISQVQTQPQEQMQLQQLQQVGQQLQPLSNSKVQHQTSQINSNNVTERNIQSRNKKIITEGSGNASSLGKTRDHDGIKGSLTTFNINNCAVSKKLDLSLQNAAQPLYDQDTSFEQATADFSCDQINTENEAQTRGKVYQGPYSIKYKTQENSGGGGGNNSGGGGNNNLNAGTNDILGNNGLQLLQELRQQQDVNQLLELTDDPEINQEKIKILKENILLKRENMKNQELLKVLLDILKTQQQGQGQSAQQQPIQNKGQRQNDAGQFTKNKDSSSRHSRAKTAQTSLTNNRKLQQNKNMSNQNRENQSIESNNNNNNNPRQYDNDKPATAILNQSNQKNYRGTINHQLINNYNNISNLTNDINESINKITQNYEMHKQKQQQQQKLQKNPIPTPQQPQRQFLIPKKMEDIVENDSENIITFYNKGDNSVTKAQSDSKVYSSAIEDKEKALPHIQQQQQQQQIPPQQQQQTQSSCNQQQLLIKTKNQIETNKINSRQHKLNNKPNNNIKNNSFMDENIYNNILNKNSNANLDIYQFTFKDCKENSNNAISNNTQQNNNNNAIINNGKLLLNSANTNKLINLDYSFDDYAIKKQVANKQHHNHNQNNSFSVHTNFKSDILDDQIDYHNTSFPNILNKHQSDKKPQTSNQGELPAVNIGGQHQHPKRQQLLQQLIHEQNQFQIGKPLTQVHNNTNNNNKIATFNTHNNQVILTDNSLGLPGSPFYTPLMKNWDGISNIKQKQQHKEEDRSTIKNISNTIQNNKINAAQQQQQQQHQQGIHSIQGGNLGEMNFSGITCNNNNQQFGQSFVSGQGINANNIINMQSIVFNNINNYQGNAEAGPKTDKPQQKAYSAIGTNRERPDARGQVPGAQQGKFPRDIFTSNVQRAKKMMGQNQQPTQQDIQLQQQQQQYQQQQQTGNN